MTTESRSDDLPPAEELLERAREAMLGMFRMAPPSAVPGFASTAETVAERVIDSQNRAFDMMRGFTSVWTDLAERGVSGPDAWKRVLEDTSRLMGTTNAAEETEHLMAAWREQGERMLEMFNPFPATAGSMGDHPFQQEMTGFLSSPAFGLGREVQGQVGALFEEWLVHKQKDFEYQRSLTEAWSEAFRKMTEKMEGMVKEGRRFENPRELMDLWVKVGDEVFTELFHTERFSQLQAEMMNAAHRVRRGRRELAEMMLRSNDLPTTSDVEAAHKAIYELRKEVRGLRRELAQLKGPSA